MSDPPTEADGSMPWADEALLGGPNDWRAATERVIRDPTSRRPFQESETVRRRDGGGGVMLVKLVMDGGARCLCGWYDDLHGELVATFLAEELVHYSHPDAT